MTTKRAAPNRPSFASCFGCVSAAGDVNEKSPTDQARRRPRWFSWARFRRRNSGTKTVPVDAPAPAPTRTIDVVEAEAEAEEIKTIIETPKKNRRQPSKGTIKDSETQTTRLPSISTKYITSRTDSPRIASRSGSPSHSPPSSSPPHPFRARPVQPIGVSRFSGKRETGREGKYGPAVGMSVVAVMLVVIILFGRTCAVVCTCALLFCLPRMRQAEPPPPPADGGDGGVKWVSGEMDVESEEYKKKVVLEGFLERSRRRPVSGGL
ncbi:hypothetical protein QJS04_geneDACA019177 [Acorus gramineus]|uniref:Uncharacterized protein n=1 Tax=Acorus gramineus TaxID=55184 RepID=A0AAV9BDD0_ACOGR|nr:hypothetical protein QJS04_geneDACA019177 [Acorus gramineus]